MAAASDPCREGPRSPGGTLPRYEVPVRKTHSILASDVLPLDPLGADDLMGRLPNLDAAALIAFLQAVPGRFQAAGQAPPAAAAALRDLGMVMASLRRHGVEPVPAAPDLEPLLLHLGEITEMVPRDTVVHYGPWNPAGPRERRFTGDDREGRLIQAVREGIPLVLRMSRELLDALGAEPFREEFEAELAAARATAERLVAILGEVQASVTPQYFAREVRPFFEPVVVGGRSYQGPAAAHMPLYIADLCLWAPRDGAFRELMESAVEYATPQGREVLEEARRLPTSLAALVAARLADAPDLAVMRCAHELRKIFRALVTFRGRHAALARAAYDAETGLFETGSGGGTPTQLLDIVRAMHEAGEAVATASLATAARRECPFSRHGAVPAFHDRESCVHALRAMYASRGDEAVAALEPVLSPDFVFHPAGRASELQGAYQGAEGMKDFLRRQSAWTADSWWPEVQDLTVGERHVIAVVEVRPRRASDDLEESFQILHRWRIQDGRITEFRSFVHDQERYDRFHSR